MALRSLSEGGAGTQRWFCAATWGTTCLAKIEIPDIQNRMDVFRANLLDASEISASIFATISN
jgi:hypothetical protein